MVGRRGDRGSHRRRDVSVPARCHGRLTTTVDDRRGRRNDRAEDHNGQPDPRLGHHHRVASDGNMQLLGLQVGGMIAPRLVAGIGSTITWADRKNMAFDFGITPEQAERRRELIDAGDGRLRDGDATAFAPHAGFKELRSTAQLGYAIYGAWQVVGAVSEGWLGHGLAESPLARESSAITTALGFVYRF
jgi:outer membrane scaffolding protein for murein synthesis (MipA/OmpV family)